MSQRSAASRAPSSSLGGSHTAVVKSLVSEDFKLDLSRFWRERGYASESDFVRELLVVTVYGPEFVTNLHRKRIESLVRNMSETSTPGGSDE
jgi:hypothetical protein